MLQKFLEAYIFITCADCLLLKMNRVPEMDCRQMLNYS